MWEIVVFFSLPKFVVVESVVEVRLVQDTRALQVAVDAAGDAALNLQFFKSLEYMFILNLIRAKLTSISRASFVRDQLKSPRSTVRYASV